MTSHCTPTALLTIVTTPAHSEQARGALEERLGGYLAQALSVAEVPSDLVAHRWSIIPDAPLESMRELMRDAGLGASDASPSAWALWAGRQVQAWQQDVGTIVTDVDSTLIEQEVIEMLAAYAGLEDQVAAVTERAMRGELDFEQSLRARVAVLKGLRADAIEEVAASIQPTRGAEAMINCAHTRGWRVCAVSGGFQRILDPLAARLGLDKATANHLEVQDGALTGALVGGVIDKAAKASHLSHWTGPDEPTLGLGDGANDLDLLGHATGGLGVTPKPALGDICHGILGLRRLDTLPVLLGWDC